MFDPKLKEALGRVQKPGRYTGGEPGSVYKDKEKMDVRFAFCFPDTYEVGMSFLGEKILYELLNSHENWWCERAFMPWLDMKAEMERLHLPLYTMESKDPLTAFDAVGFTLQYELSYTNILAMLDLAGIPFYSKDRDESWPLIVAGGPCACNAEPIADFFDVVQLGEGENQLPGICAEIEKAKKEGGVSKKELLQRIADKGVTLAYITLHVGLGTFRPVKADEITEHHMHSEFCMMSAETAELLNRTHREGHRIVCVGTTSCRTVESLVEPDGTFREKSAWTDIFIYPGYKFRALDALITNFHLPESTLVMLVSALAGRENILHAYQVAVQEKYRFFSFGDAMFIH